MDKFLADYYGTGAPQDDMGDELEKMAQLTLLTKEAAAEGVDLSQFTDEELLSMAGELYGQAPAQHHEPSQDDLQKEAAAKFEEADFLGRVMAHSMVQELGEIEKQAGKLEQAAGAVERFGRSAVNRAGGVASRIGTAARGAAEAVGERTMGAKGLKGQTAERLKKLVSETQGLRPGSARELRDLAKAQVLQRRGAQVIGGTAAGLGALGAAGGGAAYAMNRKKESSDGAFEQLVLERAQEHLAAAGYEGQEKTASDEFEQIVDRAALELLEANGYPVEWYNQ